MWCNDRILDNMSIFRGRSWKAHTWHYRWRSSPLFSLLYNTIFVQNSRVLFTRSLSSLDFSKVDYSFSKQDILIIEWDLFLIEKNCFDPLLVFFRFVSWMERHMRRFKMYKESMMRLKLKNAFCLQIIKAKNCLCPQEEPIIILKNGL